MELAATIKASLLPVQVQINVGCLKVDDDLSTSSLISDDHYKKEYL